MRVVCCHTTLSSAKTYTRLYLGQSSSPNAESVGLIVEPLAQLGQTIIEDGLASITGKDMAPPAAVEHPGKCCLTINSVRYLIVM